MATVDANDPRSPFHGADPLTLGAMYREFVGLLLAQVGAQRIDEGDIRAYRASGLEPYVESTGEGYFILKLGHPEDEKST